MVEQEVWSNDHESVTLMSPEDFYDSDVGLDVFIKLTDDIFVNNENEKISLSENNFVRKG